jgi:hypothetical protein
MAYGKPGAAGASGAVERAYHGSRTLCGRSRRGQVAGEIEPRFSLGGRPQASSRAARTDQIDAKVICCPDCAITLSASPTHLNRRAIPSDGAQAASRPAAPKKSRQTPAGTPAPQVAAGRDRSGASAAQPAAAAAPIDQWPAHRPEPPEHPGVVVVVDYLFDSTLNGVLRSAHIATTSLASCRIRGRVI